MCFLYVFIWEWTCVGEAGGIGAGVRCVESAVVVVPYGTVSAVTAVPVAPTY